MKIYKIIEKPLTEYKDTDSFQIDINEEILDGWELLGGVSICTNRLSNSTQTKNHTIMQTLYKEVDEIEAKQNLEELKELYKRRRR